jgi:hypothetical protein
MNNNMIKAEVDNNNEPATAPAQIANNNKSTRNVSVSRSENKPILEAFSLTQDSINGYELKFDDANWSRCLSSLKPLVNKIKTC